MRAPARPAVAAVAARMLEVLPELMVAERRYRGVTQRQCAEQVGYGESSLCRFERGQLFVSLPVAVRMLRWIGER